jgi:type I restriction enzyme M protein
MVPRAEIASEANDYNLNLPRYIDSSEPEDLQDLHAHLHGGIPDRDLDALSSYWEAFPSLRATLFKPNRDGYSDLAVEVSTVQQLILDSAEFRQSSADVAKEVGAWFESHRSALAAIDADTKPAELIAALGDDLLARFKDDPLLDEYDVYEQLLSYWHELMHDDVFLLMHEGWVGAAKPRMTIEDKDRKLSEDPDLVIGTGGKAERFKTDLIPPDLIVDRYFPDEKAEVEALDVQAEAATLASDEYREEHAVEGGPLWEAAEDGKVTKALVSARLKEAKSEDSDPDEIVALEKALNLFKTESAARKAAKEAHAALDLATLNKYGDLTEAEVRELVLDDKWKATVSSRVEGLLTFLAVSLVARLRELGARYDETVGGLEVAVDELSRNVAGHLAAMGVE